jgi:glutathione synthase/RimK-type ligase-like ATP-grasp enzyme
VDRAAPGGVLRQPGGAAVSARVALVTCAELPELGEDEPLLLHALRDRGVDAQPEVWDDAAVDWAGYDLVVVRSAWDYSSRRDEFVAWARTVPRLLNPADVIEWNTDKRYLRSVPRAVSTTFVEPGDRWDPPAGEYVVKPAVSAGSRDTARYSPAEESLSREHVAALQAAGRTVMVQPYLGAVDTHGETALLFFDGEYSHAIRKGQMLQPGHAPTGDVIYLEEQISAREPDLAERAAADEVLASLPWPREQLLYARVDLIPDADGSPRLVELELVEPSLFLSYSPGAGQRLAERVLQRL